MLYLLLGIAAGLCVPTQTSINGRLSKHFNAPLTASLVSFIVGDVALIIASLIKGEAYGNIGSGVAGEPFWIWFGGVIGAFFVLSNILMIQRIGSVRNVICVSLGQVLMGLINDNFGLFKSVVVKMTVFRLIGAVLVTAGVLLTVLDKGKNAGKVSDKSDYLWMIFGVFAGMVNACQTSINRYLGVIINSALLATVISFTVGAAILAVIVAVMHPIKKRTGKPSISEKSGPAWMWIGGIFGAGFVFSNAFVSNHIGTGLTVIALLIGSTAGGIIIDGFGLFGIPKRKIKIPSYIGIAIMLLGVALIRLS